MDANEETEAKQASAASDVKKAGEEQSQHIPGIGGAGLLARTKTVMVCVLSFRHCGCR